ncbi:MAG: phosphoribosyltransferase [Elusimicrobia bacterium]|nr:phosphoribosyltransferase [Elusimicrobiota bacterium]
MFRDRTDAGARLAWELSRYKDRKDALVLAIPRGGMPVGGEIARELGLALNAILIAKLEHPDEPGVVIGAVSLTSVDVDSATTGEGGVSEEYVAAAVEKARAVLRGRYWDYHRAVRFTPVAGRIVILTDDEAASELSLIAAVRRLRREGAAKIVAAVPVASREAYEALRRAADEVVCLRVVESSTDVCGLYRDFSSVTEDEALAALRRTSRASMPFSSGSSVR